MSAARKERNWPRIYDLALDREKAEKFRKSVPSQEEDQCSMCGEFCSMKRDY
jgi:phosphomethylpyrimidine synthase